MKKIKLILSIRSLDIGGAERQFIALIKHIDKSCFDVSVCTMYGGVQEDEVKKIENIRYYNLQKSGRYDIIGFSKRYASLLRELHPDVIYSFLGEMNLFSFFCKSKNTRIIWGFRASNMDLKQYGKVSRLIFWLQKVFSSRVNKIIANSHASITFHQKKGFSMSYSVVIANGIDTEHFTRDEKKRESFRSRYGLQKNEIAIGIVARIDYMKGYTVLSQAAKKLLETYENVTFFSIGGGDDNIKKECEDILGNHPRFHWLGSQKEIENIYSGLDISVSSSFGEGFSNSIAEAMACECACVVTDVGDSASIIGENGYVVAPQSVERLYEGIKKMIESDYKRIGKEGRERVLKHFSIERMVQKTQKEINELE